MEKQVSKVTNSAPQLTMSKCVSLSCFCKGAATVALLVILATQRKDISYSGHWQLLEPIGSARTVLHPPKDLNPPGLQVVDLKSFSFLINNDICGRGPVAIVTIVSSALTNKVREAPQKLVHF